MARRPIKRVHINGIEYTYVVGRYGGTICIRRPDRKVILTDTSKVFGLDWDTVERGWRKRWLPGVGPGDVKRWLEIYLEYDADFSIWLPGWRRK